MSNPTLFSQPKTPTQSKKPSDYRVSKISRKEEMQNASKEHGIHLIRGAVSEPSTTADGCRRHVFPTLLHARHPFREHGLGEFSLGIVV